MLVMWTANLTKQPLALAWQPIYSSAIALERMGSVGIGSMANPLSPEHQTAEDAEDRRDTMLLGALGGFPT